MCNKCTEKFRKHFYALWNSYWDTQELVLIGWNFEEIVEKHEDLKDNYDNLLIFEFTEKGVLDYVIWNYCDKEKKYYYTKYDGNLGIIKVYRD